jgi:hypothetical protein
MLGVIAGIHPTADSLDAAPTPAPAGPLRLHQHRHVGPSLRAPPVATSDLTKASWWTRLLELVFGW